MTSEDVHVGSLTYAGGDGPSGAPVVVGLRSGLEMPGVTGVVRPGREVTRRNDPY